MSDEIVEVVEKDLAKPVLESIEKVGEAVPRHFGEIGEKLEQTAASHVENEAGVVARIESEVPSLQDVRSGSDLCRLTRPATQRGNEKRYRRAVAVIGVAEATPTKLRITNREADSTICI